MGNPAFQRRAAIYFAVGKIPHPKPGTEDQNNEEQNMEYKTRKMLKFKIDQLSLLLWFIRSKMNRTSSDNTVDWIVGSFKPKTIWVW